VECMCSVFSQSSSIRMMPGCCQIFYVGCAGED
jgi:hypothetical protein